MLLGLFFQLLNILNFFFAYYIILILFFFGRIETISEIFFITSFIIIFTQGLSANNRNIYLGTKKSSNFEGIILHRTLIGIVLFTKPLIL